MDHQVRSEAHLQDILGKGGNVCFAHHIRPMGLPGFRLEILGPSCAAIAVPVTTATIATTVTLPALTQAQVWRLLPAVLCELLGIGLV